MPFLNSAGVFLGGTPSPITRDMGNPHGKVRKLRQALYATLNYSEVQEIYPEWDEKEETVTWRDATGTQREKMY
jgi:hypothetical protein